LNEHKNEMDSAEPAYAATGCGKSDDHSGHAHQYTCPMKEHSDVVSDKPGNCPKCGMKLVEKK
jgi:hypothetical protein